LLQCYVHLVSDHLLSCYVRLRPWTLVTVLCALTSLYICYSVMCTYAPEHLLPCYVHLVSDHLLSCYVRLRPWTLVTVLCALTSLNTCYSVMCTYAPEHLLPCYVYLVSDHLLPCYVHLHPWTLVTVLCALSLWSLVIVLCALTSLNTCYSVMCTDVLEHLLHCYVYLRPWALANAVFLSTHSGAVCVCANANNTDRTTVTITTILFHIIARFHSQNTWTDSPANGRSSCFCWTDVQQQESHWTQRAVLEGWEGWHVHVNISPVSGNFARRTAHQFCSDPVIETYRTYSYCNWKDT
jgi:hypothetical protein